ncbi:MAG: GNAT family N-acetyltransferase [Candidatus Nanosalina sp.]
MGSGELDYNLPVGYNVRRADESDLEDITEVYQSAYPDNTDYPLVSSENVEKMLEDENVDYYVVENNEGDVKAAAANLYNSLNQGNVQPGRLAVAVDARGEGLGKALLAERTEDLLDEDVSGIAFSGGATSHPASQGNLYGRGYEVFCADRQINESYFSNRRETEIMFIHPDTVERDDRTVYLPEEYREIAEINLGKISDDLAGRTIESHIEPSTDAKFGLTGKIWFLTEIDGVRSEKTLEEVMESLEEEKSREDHLMLPVDANTPSTVALYPELEERGFELEGFAPDWFTRNGENRDAVMMQYSPQEPETIEVIDPVKQLLEDIGADFRIKGREGKDWILEY